MNFVTTPLIADLFLLAILAIGRKEVHDGTVGADHIYPIDIMVFFLSLAYIAISIDASGLIRWLSFKVLQKAGHHGHLLFFYLYVFFFTLASFIGNDPIILSGTAFLAYMTRVSENIRNPRAWIHTQFALANIGSAVLVSSNPTNLVLAGAFKITFITYTANVIVPVVVTVILLFPFLLWVLFRSEALLPSSITLHELPEESKNKEPANPNIPYSRGPAEEEDEESEDSKRMSLEEVLNPYLDRPGAWVSAGTMAVTLIIILAVNASLPNGTDIPVFYMTLPAAVIVFSYGIVSGWMCRAETREAARQGKKAVDDYRAEKVRRDSMAEPTTMQLTQSLANAKPEIASQLPGNGIDQEFDSTPRIVASSNQIPTTGDTDRESEKATIPPDSLATTPQGEEALKQETQYKEPNATNTGPQDDRKTLVLLVIHGWRWCRETFPTVTTVLEHLPYPLVPFSFCMFVLVQALVTRGWITVFAYGWSHWVEKTGTLGAIGGMAFLSVVLCNFAGTNIGTTILLCRLMQAWVKIHAFNNDLISQRTFWATVYSMAIGVNYGAFSTFFSASLAGLLWRDILRRKHIIVKELEFARVNLPIITFCTIVGCVVLVGEVYIMRSKAPYQDSG